MSDDEQGGGWSWEVGDETSAESDRIAPEPTPSAADHRPPTADLQSPAAPLSRRAALKVLGVLPLAAPALLGQQTQTPPQQQVPVNPPATPSSPAAGAKQPPDNRPKRKFFNAREWRIAAVLADDIIPRDERSGSATQAGVLDYIDFHMSVPETSDEARTAMHGGLRWLDTECRRRFGVGYDRAKVDQRHQLLDDVSVPSAQAKPEMRAGVAFFATFRNYVGAGFFSSAMGWKDLRYLGNVFNPNWNGCPQPALDKLGVSYDVMKTRVAPG